MFESTKELDKLLENSISIWFNHHIDPYKVMLQISAEVAKYFIRKPISKSQIIESPHEDGSIVVSVEITDDREIIPFVKYWIPHIKVLEPTKIKDAIEHDLKLYIQKTL